MSKFPITLTVNGEEHSLEVEPRTLLVHLIRENLNLTGTHIGCDTTSCGACTVIMDGKAVKSCTVFAVQANGRSLAEISYELETRLSGTYVRDPDITVEFVSREGWLMANCTRCKRVFGSSTACNAATARPA